MLEAILFDLSAFDVFFTSAAPPVESHEAADGLGGVVGVTPRANPKPRRRGVWKLN